MSKSGGRPPPDSSAFELCFGVPEPTALPVGFQTVDPMRQPVEHGTGEPLAAEHLHPVLERQVVGDDHAGAS